MSAPNDLDRRLAAWMSQAVSSSRPAGRFERVVDATSRRRPRPRWLATFGVDWVGTVGDRTVVAARRAPVPSMLPGAIVVLLVAATVIGVAWAGGVANQPDPLTSQSPTPAAPGSPTASASFLAAGTVSLPNPCVSGCPDYRQILVTLPAGWTMSGGRLAKHQGQPNEMAISAWAVDAVYDDPCHWQSSGLSPLDNIHPHDGAGGLNLSGDHEGGLLHQAGRTASSMTGEIVGGIGAARIELSIPSDLDIAKCDLGQFRSWTASDGSANAHHASGQVDDVYIVDLDRRPLVIDVSHMPTTSPADVAELEHILATLIIDGGP